MGFCRLSLSAVAALAFMIVANPGPVVAASAAASAVAAETSVRAGAKRIEHLALHRHRTQSFYCFPKNHWWFYRPYTTAFDGHARCMPYFHYLGPDGRRGAQSDQYIK